MEENKNQPNKENMSNKDDNATHLNDSQRNEDLELFRRNKNARQRRRRRIDNQSKEKDATSTQSQLETKPMDKFIDNHKSHNQDKEIKSDLIEDNVNDENDNQKNINDKLNDRIVQETNESRQSTEDDEEFLLDHRSEQQPKASRHSKKHKLLSKFTSKKEKETSTSFNNNEKVTQIKPLSLEEKRAIRRKKQKRIQYTIITLLILIIVLILLYMFTPLSKISNVNVKGNNNVSTSKIKKELNVTSRSRMYTFSKNKAIRNLKQNPLIKEVDIHKQLPNTLTVNVTEYQIVGLEKNKDKYVPIIEGGKELTEYKDEVSHDGPIIDGFKGDKKTRIIKALSEMSPKVRNLIAEVSYAPTKNKQSRIKIFTKDNMQVIGDITTIADKMQYYPQMSQSLSRDDSGELKTNGYIDLSVGASFIPYQGSSTVQSGTEQNVTKSTQEENDAKEELQNVLNKINKQSKENN
ncbi:cell division protein FtsQ/DivIB [Staphylococcus epidermidis]|uniref:cell division protein FtsQ/DivIB n=1 Tax=Staphylococcus epidermidis TaxID=1282 RepID=UPI001931FD1D|nr:FtsQ-type POTRA domain-containing protein [Staphylococcus epidermidis]